MPILNNFVIEFLYENSSSQEGFENSKVDVGENLVGRGFNSILTPIKIVKRRGCCIYVDELIVKSAPTNQSVRKLIPFDVIFEREAYIYNTVFEEYRELDNEKMIEISKRFVSVPKCHGTSLAKGNETIILENLSGGQNYLTWDESKQMTRNHINLVLIEYAKLHALSFILKKRKPDVFLSIKEHTPDIYMDIISKCKTTDTIELLCDRVLSSFQNGDVFEKLNAFKSNVIETMIDLVKIDAAGDYGVVLHGDNWCNNMLFQYKENSEEPTSVKLIDFQLSRFGSPILDLSTFLFTSASAEILETTSDLLKHYYAHFEKYLEMFQIEAETVFPYEKLSSDWTKFAKFGLGMAFLVIQVMCMDKIETPMIEEEWQSGTEFIAAFQSQTKNNDLYLEKMRKLIEHCSKTGVI